MEVAKEILRKKGVELVELDFAAEINEIIKTTFACFFSVPFLINLVSKKLEKHMQEPLVRDFEEMHLMTKLPRRLIPLVKRVLKYMGESRKIMQLEAYEMSLQYGTMYLARLRLQMTEIFIDKLLSLGIESFLCYGMVTPATLHNNFSKTFVNSIYTSIFNFLNFPVGVIPITLVKKEEQFYSDNINDSFTKCLDNNMKNSAGLPVGIQVCGLPWKDELVMKIMSEIESEIKEDFRCEFQKSFFQ